MTVMAAALAAPAMGLFMPAAPLSRSGLAWERTGRWTGSNPRPSSRSSSPGHWWTCRAPRRRGCRCTAAPSRRWGCSRRPGSRWQSCTGSRPRRRRCPRGTPPPARPTAPDAGGGRRRGSRRVLAGGALAAGVLAAGAAARVTVLVTVGLGFAVLTAAGAVTVLETVGLGSGTRTTVVVAAPHAVTAVATMATAPAAPAIGILMIALPRQPHHPLPYQLKPAIPANRRTIPELTPRKSRFPSSTRLARSPRALHVNPRRPAPFNPPPARSPRSPPPT